MTVGENGKAIENPVRTSYGTFMTGSLADDEVVQALERRIAGNTWFKYSFEFDRDPDFEIYVANSNDLFRVGSNPARERRSILFVAIREWSRVQTSHGLVRAERGCPVLDGSFWSTHGNCIDLLSWRRRGTNELSCKRGWLTARH